MHKKNINNNSSYLVECAANQLDENNYEANLSEILTPQ